VVFRSPAFRSHRRDDLLQDRYESQQRSYPQIPEEDRWHIVNYRGPVQRPEAVHSDVATPRSLPTLPTAIFGFLLVVGAVTLIFGAASSDAELAKRTYRVFLHNWLLWAVLSNGALALSAGMRLTNARWQGPIQRVADSMGAYLPVSLVLFAVIYAGRHHLFEWVDHPIAGKEFWY
jgi:hypothetical protein